MDIGERQMAQQVRHAFIVTSAVNSKFGIFSPEQRLNQTIDTINSIKAKVSNPLIIVMECCGNPIRKDQEDILRKNCHVFVDYSQDADVQAMYDSDNWDVVKNGTEIMCFGRALAVLHNEDIFKDIDRIHKMSGRYVLNDMFDVETYDKSDVMDKIVIEIGRAHV